MITTRKLKNIDMESFRKEIKNIVDEVLISENGFEESYRAFKTPAERLLNEVAPVTIRRIQKKKEPKWMDEEYKKSRQERRKLERKWRKDKKKEDLLRYQEQSKSCAELAIKKQERHLSSLVENSSSKQNSLFKVVSKALDKNTERILPAHTDPKELANDFNQYYIDKIDKLRETIPPTNEQMNGVKFKGTKLEAFAPTTIEEVRKIIKEHGIKTSCEDPLPASVIQSSIEELLPLYVELINRSLGEGSLNGVKHSEIDPLLKKLGLDSDVKKNFRPVNNLVFFSKLIERIVKKRIDAHMEVNKLFTKEFFGYKEGHSTETMMVGVVDDILTGFDDDKCTVMMFLDMSAAFDTIDIDKMVDILEEEIGLAGRALLWCQSFLSNRTQRVKIDDQYSNPLEIKFGTVQGSVLGPKFFNIYVRGQPKVFHNSGFQTTAFADDSNGMKTFSICFQYNVLKNDVAKCLENVTNWMNMMCLKINPDKTEIVLFHPKSLSGQVIIRGILVGNDCIRFSREVKNVGVWLDENMKLDKHINNIVSYCYSLLKNIGRVRNILSNKHTEMLVHAVTTSRLDYCNSLLINIGKSNLFKLQKIQNAAARLVVRGRKRQSISGTIKELHWLRVESRIIFKVLLLVYKSIHGLCSENLQLHYKGYNCRPQDYLLLETKSAKTKYGKRTFSYAGPRLWNALPLHIRSEENIDKFKTQVKTLLFEGTEELKKRAYMYN